jgi:DNA invertase Pin-like site-specific DNA recombinase
VKNYAALDFETAARRVQESRARLAADMKAAAQTAIDAHAAGIPETEIAAALGVNRMTVRRWLGKL